MSIIALIAAAVLAASPPTPDGARDDGRPVPTAVLRPVAGSGTYGSASFAPHGSGGSVAVLVVRRLKPNAAAQARLYAGTSLGSLGASFTLLPDLRANRRGYARSQGRVLYRGVEDVAFEDVADGRHSVVIVSRGRVVAFGVVPRDG